ncbi:MAG: ankyrin repeat domain-containing protein, partial [Dehalococcoidia bacterium]
MHEGRAFESKTWLGWNIFEASRLGRLDIVRALIEEHGEDPNIVDDNGHRPLDYAIASSSTEVRAYLESQGAQPYLAVSEVPPVPSNPVRPPDVSTSSAYSVESFKRRFLTF